MSNITQRWGNLPQCDRHFLCLLSPYGGSVPPCWSVNAPTAVAVLDSGTGGTVSFLPNLIERFYEKVNNPIFEYQKYRSQVSS